MVGGVVKPACAKHRSAANESNNENELKYTEQIRKKMLICLIHLFGLFVDS